MSREERTARRELATLAADERGRALLQLALRGIERSDRGLTIGCWVKPGGGVAGCVFQHAYWQGVAEGTFAAGAAAKPEIKEFVPDEDFRLVMAAIRALDTLGKRRFMRRHGLRRTLDDAAWRSTVERLLVDALADAPQPAPAYA
ncbi:MAG TPA: hypothetical protein VGF23_09420 [Gaiellaceae bacterium]|jgi:hypothetical protein